MQHTPHNTPLISDRFTLRPVQTSDVGLLAVHSADLRVAKMFRGIPHPLPAGVVEAYIADATAPTTPRDVWVMDGSASNHAEVMGAVALTRLDRNQSEIAFWTAPAFWNTGLASEAVAMIIAANPQAAAQIYAEVFQDNPGSARVLTRAGFAYLGDAEAFCVARDTTVPTWTYVLKLDR